MPPLSTFMSSAACASRITTATAAVAQAKATGMPTMRCQVVSSHDGAPASRTGPASRSSAFENRESASAGGRIASLAAVVAESSRSASSIAESADASLRSHSSTAERSAPESVPFR